MAPASPHPFRTFPTMSLGCDYNPEQWPEEVWTDDVRLMRQAGVGFVTVGVFSWALLEPEPGRYELDWLERVLDLLHGSGIAVDLATATASPPPWLTTLHPDVLPVDGDGRRLWHGSRQSWCPSSPVFAERSVALVEQVAGAFGDHPAVAMWHVSNELGCHNGRCWCDVSAAAFRRWLLDRYGDVEALNEAWGTTFWSQRYSDIEEVLPPRATTAQPNPTHALDFARFSSDELLAAFERERDVLRRLSPDVPVTTNFMVTAHQDEQDYWRWAPQMDVVSNDHYLDARLEHPLAELSLSGDVTRGLAGGRPWLLMEHSTSAVNWQPVNVAKAPGELLRTALAHVARGADGVGYFQWRASRAGAERFHSALLPHAGTDTKVWREVVELGTVLGRLSDVAGTEVVADVALVFDWEAWWACDTPSMPSERVRYLDQVQAWHRALWRLGVTTDAVHPSADLSGYRLVVVPTLVLASDEAAQNLARFVAGGGHVLVTYFSGVLDENSHVRLGGYPGAFRDLLGVWTEEFFPLRDGEVTRLDGGPVDGTTGAVWTEALHLRGAEAVARHADGPLPGVPAVTRHAVGGGTAWYVATRLDDDGAVALARTVVDHAGVRPAAATPDGVEVVRRRGGSGSYLFALNHSRHKAVVAVTGRDLVGGRELRATPGPGYSATGMDCDCSVSIVACSPDSSASDSVPWPDSAWPKPSPTSL